MVETREWHQVPLNEAAEMLGFAIEINKQKNGVASAVLVAPSGKVRRITHGHSERGQYKSWHGIETCYKLYRLGRLKKLWKQ